jgi:hypothetical protein
MQHVTHLTPRTDVNLKGLGHCVALGNPQPSLHFAYTYTLLGMQEDSEKAVVDAQI